MTYAPSGAMVAAPTTSLPEQAGGERDWDYRYAWVRDASLPLHALPGLGFTDEATAFTEWLGDRVQEVTGSGEHPLKVMYRVDGSSDLAEQTLGHWEGYRSSSPVRVGNGAADQLQLDIYGSALECLHLADLRGLPTTCRIWEALINTVDWVCENWDRPEAGIWETRGGDKDFTHGRIMSWIALDRAVRMAARSGRPGEVQRWTRQRDAACWQIVQRGRSAERAAFTQYLGSEVLDSALLRMPTVGFIPPAGPAVALDAGRDQEGSRVRRPRVPVRSLRLSGRAARFRRHLLGVHVLVRRGPRPRSLRATDDGGGRRSAGHAGHPVSVGPHHPQMSAPTCP